MDINKIMKQAQQMQSDMMAVQEEVAAMTFTGTSGGGVVEAVATGTGQIESVKIKPEAVDPEDVEMLEDMVVTAVNEALRLASEAASAKMGAVTGGLNIPGVVF